MEHACACIDVVPYAPNVAARHAPLTFSLMHAAIRLTYAAASRPKPRRASNAAIIDGPERYFNAHGLRR
jgi:hypothetical protein